MGIKLGPLQTIGLMAMSLDELRSNESNLSGSHGHLVPRAVPHRPKSQGSKLGREKRKNDKIPMLGSVSLDPQWTKGSFPFDSLDWVT